MLLFNTQTPWTDNEYIYATKGGAVTFACKSSWQDWQDWYISCLQWLMTKTKAFRDLLALRGQCVKVVSTYTLLYNSIHIVIYSQQFAQILSTINITRGTAFDVLMAIKLQGFFQTRKTVKISTLSIKINEPTRQIHGHGAAKEIPCPMKEFSWFCKGVKWPLLNSDAPIQPQIFTR